MMQGDKYNMSILLRNNAGQVITPTDVANVEIAIGNMVKNYKSGTVTYRDGLWLFPLEQEETFAQWPRKCKAQVRVEWRNGAIEGQELEGVRFEESISKEVL